MRNTSKGLIAGAILGLGVGLLINKVLNEKSLDGIKKDTKENMSKAKEVIKENVEKVKENIGEYRRENTSSRKVEI